MSGRNGSYIIKAEILRRLERSLVPVNDTEAKTLRKAEISPASKAAEVKTVRKDEISKEVASVAAGLRGAKSSPLREMARGDGAGGMRMKSGDESPHSKLGASVFIIVHFF